MPEQRLIFREETTCVIINVGYRCALFFSLPPVLSLSPPSFSLLAIHLTVQSSNETAFQSNNNNDDERKKRDAVYNQFNLSWQSNGYATWESLDKLISCYLLFVQQQHELWWWLSRFWGYDRYNYKMLALCKHVTQARARAHTAPQKKEPWTKTIENNVNYAFKYKNSFCMTDDMHIVQIECVYLSN